MIPREILSRLAELRRRERTLRFVWGGACLLSTIAAAVLLGCVIDYVWDRNEETPFAVRAILLGITVAAAVAGFLYWVLRPQVESLPDDDLALMVEGKHPTFRNRLISAVQLNRVGARKQGMSEELITLVTQEAETQSRDVAFPSVTDHSRVGTALKILAPVAAVCLALLLWQPVLGSILLARHFLAGVDIPRRTHIEPLNASVVKPTGDSLAVEFLVTGTGFDENSVGVADVVPAGQPRDRYELKFKEKTPQGMIFASEIAPSGLDISYTARLGDGRTKSPGTIKVVQRPIVTDQFAFTVLPEFCGLTPSKHRYEVPQARGDVAGIPGSDVRIVAKAQKPIASAIVEILAPEHVDPKKVSDDIPEKVVRTIPCQIQDDIEVVEKVDEKTKKSTFTTAVKTKNGEATCTFNLKPEESGYRIVLKDEYDFVNKPAPRRNLRVVPEEPPTVLLLKDYFAPTGAIDSKASLDDFHVEGLPIPIGAVLRVPYLAEGHYGLGRAFLLYRVLKKTESGNEIVENQPWNRLELTEVTRTKNAGQFDQRRGVFANTPADSAVGFYAEPSPDPERILGRTVGGGRAHFKTGGIPDGKGGTLKLNEGDKIEYCIEVHADKNPDSKRPTARSDTRVQPLLTNAEGLIGFIRSLAREEQQLRQIEADQKKTFDQR